MGTHGAMSNTKKSRKHSKNGKRIAKRVHRKNPKVVCEVPHAEIAPVSATTQRRKNSRTNVEISGKMKRKVMKQLKRLQKAKDVDMEDASGASTSKQKKKQPKVKDITMESNEDTNNATKEIEDSDDEMDV